MHFSSGANITPFGVENLLEKVICSVRGRQLWANRPPTVISRACEVEKPGACKSEVLDRHSEGLEPQGKIRPQTEIHPDEIAGCDSEAGGVKYVVGRWAMLSVMPRIVPVEDAPG